MILNEKITTVLFDLDGTLAPFDYEVFFKIYMGKIGEKSAAIGLDPELAVKSVWSATKLVFKNDGTMRNDELFWKEFSKLIGEDGQKYRDTFDEFYRTDFDLIKKVVTPNPYARRLVDFLKEGGLNIIVATNPVFPQEANRKRLSWVNLHEGDFSYISCYENSHFCKPNPKYYEEILEKNGLKAENCLMIGNDVAEDMIAKDLGMEVFLVTDCLINRDNKDISCYNSDTFKGLYEKLIQE